MNKKVLIPTFLLISTLFFSYSAVAVQGENGEPGPQFERPSIIKKDKEILKPDDKFEQKVVREDKQNQRRVEVCENFEEKAQTRIDRFGHVRQKHVEIYQRLLIRLNDIAEALTDKGFDTAQLKEDIATLESLVKDYSAAYADFVASLNFVRGYGCGDADDNFRDSLDLSKEKLVALKEIRAEIRKFYTTVIREDIKNLRQQASDLQVESSDDEESSE